MQIKKRRKRVVKKPFIFILFMALSVFSFSQVPYYFTSQPAPDSYWVPIGPPGGDIRGIVFKPGNTNELYAVASGSSSQVYKSTDSGQSWTRLSTFANSAIAMAIDPSNANNIYILHGTGIYKSTNGGTSWVSRNFGANAYGYSGRISVSAANPSLIFATGFYVYSSAPTKTRMALFKSTDRGETWSVIQDNSSLTDYAYLYALALDPTNSNIVYIGGYSKTGSTYSYKLYKSSNGGNTYDDKTGSINSPPRDIVIDPTNPSKVYVATEFCVYRSANAGLSWSRNNGSVNAYALAVDSSNPNVLYAGYYKKCYKSTDGGVNWTALGGTLAGDCQTLLVSGNRVYYGGTAGVYRSDNSGTSWQASSRNINAAQVLGLAITPSSPNILFSGPISDGLYKSTDYGANWTRLPIDADVPECDEIFDIGISPNNGNDIFLVTWNNIYRSRDGGNTWANVLSGNKKHLIINPGNTDHVFAAGYDSSGGSAHMTMSKSTDGGNTWTTFKMEPSNSRAHSIAVDPVNDNVIYLGGEKNSQAYLLKSLNGGTQWTDITGSISRTIQSVAVDRSTPQRVYAGTYNGLYKSENSGASWSMMSSRPVQCITTSASNAGVIFSGGLDGVSVSLDDGTTWTDYNAGLEIKDTWRLDFDPANNILYSGTGNGGIYKNILSDIFSLVLNSGAGGTTDPAPGTYLFFQGTSASVTANPSAHYAFSYWTGSASGSANPVTLVMNSDKTVTANFLRIINPPLNFSGRRVSNRSLSRVEYINVLTWDPDPDNENITGYIIRRVEDGSETLIAELDGSTFKYEHRKIDKNKSYTYSIVAVNDEGRGGIPAYVIIQ